MIAEWIGGRSLVGWCLILSSVFTAAGPFVADSFWILYATRFLVGVFGVNENQFGKGSSIMKLISLKKTASISS